MILTVLCFGAHQYMKSSPYTLLLAKYRTFLLLQCIGNEYDVLGACVCGLNVDFPEVVGSNLCNDLVLEFF